MQKQAEREHALSNFVKYAWGDAVFQKQTKREHALSSLSSMPGEMPLCKNKPKENMLCQVCLVKYRKRTCFVKYAWGDAVVQKQTKREHALSSLSSMPGEVPLCKTS